MAEQSRTDLQTTIDANVPDNEAHAISPADVREALTNLNDSGVNKATDTNLIGLYSYDATKQYYTNEITNYAGNWYKANTDPVVGAFASASWDALSNNLFKASVTIETAQVLTLNSVPVSIVSAVAGKSIMVVSATLKVIYNSAAYATNTQARLITDTATISQLDFLTGLNATVSRKSHGRLNTAAIGATDTQLIDNKALMVSCATGDPTAGNSQIVVDVFYLLV